MRKRPSRWDYMSRPQHNPPSDQCPECPEPSKVHYIGGKSILSATGEVTGTQHRYQCEHGHRWVVVE